MTEHPIIEKVADSVILRLVARASMALCVPLILAFIFWNTTTLVELRESVVSITTDLAWIQRTTAGTNQRERNGRSQTVVANAEHETVSQIGKWVRQGSTIHADEASHWDRLHAAYEARRINHAEAYSHNGACTNQAESFFSRLRRAEIGTHHHFAGRYLEAYSDEMAWREDHRRLSNGRLYQMAVGAALRHPVSRQWKGYWQRGA